MTTKADLTKLLVVLNGLYPHQAIGKGLDETGQAVKVAEAAGIWYQILGDIPFDLLSLAVKDIAASGREFYPPAGVIRQAALELTATDADRITPGDAWSEVQRAFKNYGHTRAPEWSHSDIERTVKAVGGWRYLCTSENAMADRARFMDTFKVYRKRAETDRRMLPATREFVAQHRQIEADGSAGLIEAEVKRLAEGMAR